LDDPRPNPAPPKVIWKQIKGGGVGDVREDDDSDGDDD
jgi:hypothetical protein